MFLDLFVVVSAVTVLSVNLVQINDDDDDDDDDDDAFCSRIKLV